MSDFSRPIRVVRPNRIDFGAGTVGLVGEWAIAKGYKRPLVISDAFNASRVDLLGLPGVLAVFGDVRPEPDIPNLELALGFARDAQPDLVIGFGGGSAMDLAKLVAVLVDGEKSLAEIVGVEKAPARRVGLVQVPTTSGTGSEAGNRALVTDPVTRNKLAVESPHMLADLAVVDPSLTISVPPAVTAATGVDAMAHCVEAFTSRKAHPLIDTYALDGIRLVGRYLARAVRDGSDVEARSGLSMASLYGGFCLGPVNTAGGHALAYPLGTRHHVAHGAANALVFPHVLAFNVPSAEDRTAQVLQALGLDGVALQPEAILAATYAFCGDLGIEMRLSGLNVPRDDLGAMADEAFAIRRLLDNNPRELGRDQILSIYEAAY